MNKPRAATTTEDFDFNVDSPQQSVNWPVVSTGNLNEDIQMNADYRPWHLLSVWSVAALVATMVTTDLRAQNTKVNFTRDIRPLLSDNCFACHGPDQQQRQAALRLDIRKGAFAELESGGFAIIPRKRAASKLLSRVSSADDDLRMPPPEIGKQLTGEQIEMLGRWIDQGANWTGHWAYQKPARPPIPVVSDDEWPSTHLDRFILAQLERRGMRPSPLASRYTLARRVALDLVGLPPSVGQVESFVQDTRPDTYHRMVDRLLASPHYGEHRARY